MKPYHYDKLTLIPLVLTLAGILMLCPFGVGLSPIAKFFAAFVIGIISLQGVPAVLVLPRMVKRFSSKKGNSKSQSLTHKGVDTKRLRKILIADQSADERTRLEAFFSAAPFVVESTASAAYAIAQIVRHQDPIVILGDAFEEEITTSEVIALMRKCNKNLSIIQVSDDGFSETLQKIRESALSCEPKGHNQKENREISHMVESAVEVFSRQCPNL